MARSKRGRSVSQPDDQRLFGIQAQFASPPPPLIRPLFLPRFLQRAAADQRGRTEAREEAREAVRAWINNLPTIAAQNEIQIEADFYTGFLKPLGYRRPEPDRSEWTLQPKYTIPGDGIVDAALGTFRADASGNAIQGEPLVVVERAFFGLRIARPSAQSGRVARIRGTFAPPGQRRSPP